MRSCSIEVPRSRKPHKALFPSSQKFNSQVAGVPASLMRESLNASR
jgi:hypothetical protein